MSVRILVIDDDVDDQLIFREIIEEIAPDLECISAHNGRWDSAPEHSSQRRPTFGRPGRHSSLLFTGRFFWPPGTLPKASRDSRDPGTAQACYCIIRGWL